MTDAKEPEVIAMLRGRFADLEHLAARQMELVVERKELDALSAILDHIDTLTRERDAARTVTDAMINKGWSLLQARCVEEYKGLLDLVEREDFADALTAAFAPEDT